MKCLVIGAHPGEVCRRISDISGAMPVTVQQSTNLPSALALQADARFDLVVILQEWPEEYSQTDCWTVLDRFPLARLVVCCGRWCDSDGRTRDLWPAATRVGVAEMGARIRAELAVCHDQSDPLPRTGSRDDAFAFHQVTCPERNFGELVINVKSPDPAVTDWLHGLFSAGGHAVCSDVGTSTQVIVWDGDPATSQLFTDLKAQVHSMPQIAVGVLLGFPDRQQERRFLDAGAECVLSKLATGTELLHQLEDAWTHHSFGRRSSGPQRSPRISTLP